MSAFLMAAALAMAGPDHEGCPMAAAHAAHRADVDRRHDEATGVAHDGSVHHFTLAPDGGAIRLEVDDAADVEGRDRIREHLRAIAGAFAAGDFTLPERIHGQVPPGVDVMTARRDLIHYEFAPTERGGVVTVRTTDDAALDAVHRFLRFQIEDHATGDPSR